MRAILIRDVQNLGKAGDVVSVADGYARNYLLPKRLAIEATPGTLRNLEQQRVMESKRGEKLLDDVDALAARLQEISVVVIGKVGKGTRLYGSVTAQDIADALKAQHHIEIDKRKIDVIAPIKSLGTYAVPVRLQRTITANLQVEVLTEEQAAAPRPPKPEPAPEEPARVEEPTVEAAEEPAVEVVEEPEPAAEAVEEVPAAPEPEAAEPEEAIEQPVAVEEAEPEIEAEPEAEEETQPVVEAVLAEEPEPEIEAEAAEDSAAAVEEAAEAEVPEESEPTTKNPEG